MKTLHYRIKINAPREKVWEAILGEETFRQWTAAFCPHSYFEGEWKKGARMRFIANDNGTLHGMISEIAELKPHEFVSIRHIGVLEDGVENTSSEAMKEWLPAFENYTFNQTPTGTEVIVDMDTAPSYVDFFNETWPKALQKLKEISEK